MNLTNESGQYLNENHSSTDDEEEEDHSNNRTCPNPPSICIETLFSDQDQEEFDSSDDEDIDDDDEDEENDGSDIENHYHSKCQPPVFNRLTSILRQSNRLVELKLNILLPRQSLRHALSDSDMSKHSHHQREHDQQQSRLLSSSSLSTTPSRRLYLPPSFLCNLQSSITSWLHLSTNLIDSISPFTYHRRCWPQLLLTFFIERGLTNFDFLRCTQSVSLTTMNEDSCSIHKHGCILEDQAYKLSAILQKGAKFQIDSVVFDHIRRIIVIKSLQEVINDNSNLQQIYVKQLKCLKQSLVPQQSSFISSNKNTSINVSSMYSKLLLFLSSLYSIKSETMQTLFCQHLLHNPTYSYLSN